MDELTREELLELLRRRPVVCRSNSRGSQADVKAETIVKKEPEGKWKRERDEEYSEIMASAHVKKLRGENKEVEIVDLLDD